MADPKKKVPSPQSDQFEPLTAGTIQTTTILNKWQALLDKLQHDLSEPYREKAEE